MAGVFYYTYVLLCSDNKYYVGSTINLKKRYREHIRGKSKATKDRRPLNLVYYEACLYLSLARARERYFKTGYGRRFLKSRLIIDPR